ncbi:uncharacterized protein LOC127150506 [Cucumis melo]|uniref:Uncharacterized protein LOC127150506 n=1 Tax=Cucumis melo TaxID=3656 RepID=A0ABM3L2S5_CUCME|nr:uncharacterized protein LOC127150506 [Cucumis melo]
MKKTRQLVFTRNQEVSGFSCISECIGGVRISIWNKLKRSCARDSGSGSVLRVICVYARGIRFIFLQVEIDFPVPDRLPSSAEASLSIASTCFELGIKSVVL